MKVFILDDTFTSKAGHNASYNFAIAQEFIRQGYEVAIIAQHGALVHESEDTKGLIHPDFTRYGAEIQLNQLSFLPHHLHLFFRLLFGNIGHLLDLVKNVSSQITNGDIVIVSMYHSYHATAYAIWLTLLLLQNKRIHLRLIFHNIQSFKLLRYEIKLFDLCGKSHDVQFCSQTQALADQFLSNCQLRSTTLPFPYNNKIEIVDGFIHDGVHSVKTTYVGVALQAKGFDILVTALESSSDLLNLGKMYCVVQENILYPDQLLSNSSRNLLELSTRFPHGLRIIHGALPNEQYQRLLQETELILLPHRAASYRYARSGTYIEAIALGIPVITSNGTFMAQELEMFGSGIIFEDGDADSLANAFREAIENFGSLKQNAVLNRKNWLEIHNPKNFVKTLLNTFS